MSRRPVECDRPDPLAHRIGLWSRIENEMDYLNHRLRTNVVVALLPAGLEFAFQKPGCPMGSLGLLQPDRTKALLMLGLRSSHCSVYIHAMGKRPSHRDVGLRRSLRESHLHSFLGLPQCKVTVTKKLS